MTLIRNLALVTALSFTLAACKNSNEISEAPFEKPVISLPVNADGVFRADDIPHAQLSGNVVPQSYRVDMKMDPDTEGFSGVVEIDVEILNPTDKIWLHGKHMTVSSATAMIGGCTVRCREPDIRNCSACG